MLWTRASPETYDLLVLQRGWATAQYADRLADTLAANLLRAGTAGHGNAITRRSAWRSPAEAMRPSGIPIRRYAWFELLRTGLFVTVRYSQRDTGSGWTAGGLMSSSGSSPVPPGRPTRSGDSRRRDG